MLQVNYIKNNRDLVVEGLKKRNLQAPEILIEEIIRLDDARRSTQTASDAILSELNNISKSIGQLLKNGKKEEAETAKSKTTDLKAQSKELGEKLNRIEEDLKQALYNIPNIPHEGVPAGTSSEDNEIIFEEGAKPELNEDALAHWDLIEKYNIIDFELGNKITGAGFPVYKGKGAKLQRALISFFLEEGEKAGYEEIQPPVLINQDSGYGTGQLPDKEGQMYATVEDQLYLIPTAEVPITNLYRNIILKSEDLPVRNIGYTLCFRREAGSWGSHVRGLNRLHQFDKVEIVQITKPENSYQALDEMCNYVKGILTKLELPFRMVKLCGGDLGFTSALTYDMEVYSAAQKKWLEVSSISNFLTYQANRLRLRYKDENGKNHLLHTLNGSALALPRIVASILENNQSKDGIRIPDVLIPYTGFKMI